LDLDPPEHQSQLVVIAVFDPDSPWQVEVRHTNPLSTGGRKDSTAVEDAVVSVYRGDTLVATLDYTPERERLAGIYTAEGVFPEPGVVYTVRVSAPGFEDAEGAGHIPLVRTTPEVTFVDSLRYDPSRRRWLAELRIRDQDPAEEQNFYLLEMMRDIGDGLFRTTYETQDPILQDTPLIQLAGESSTLDRVFGDGAINGRVFEVSGTITGSKPMPLGPAWCT